jgi:hypothetical protein
MNLRFASVPPAGPGNIGTNHNVIIRHLSLSEASHESLHARRSTSACDRGL